MKYYLYNSKASTKPKIMSGIIELIDAYQMDFPNFFNKLKADDEVVLFGGDGTVNYFVNAMRGYRIRNNVYLIGGGTGNDFVKDIDARIEREVQINEYIQNLPIVRINGMERCFINNVGYGLDGYCCQVAEEMKVKQPDKEINYAAIAVKGLLFKTDSCHASIEVDGEKFEYDNVWIAPTMKGRYYGGGMKMAPDQDRFSGMVSLVIYKSKSKLKALGSFPAIFEGNHVKDKEMVKVHVGKHIKVKFSRPCTAQIDGEPVLNVSEYEVIQN